MKYCFPIQSFDWLHPDGADCSRALWWKKSQPSATQCDCTKNGYKNKKFLQKKRRKLHRGQKESWHNFPQYHYNTEWNRGNDSSWWKLFTIKMQWKLLAQKIRLSLREGALMRVWVPRLPMVGSFCNGSKSTKWLPPCFEGFPPLDGREVWQTAELFLYRLVDGIPSSSSASCSGAISRVAKWLLLVSGFKLRWQTVVFRKLLCWLFRCSLWRFRAKVEDILFFLPFFLVPVRVTCALVRLWSEAFMLDRIFLLISS